VIGYIKTLCGGLYASARDVTAPYTLVDLRAGITSDDGRYRNGDELSVPMRSYRHGARSPIEND
jgi:hypothetical protein